jgi:L-fuculose-phosphate aldolase
MKHELRGEIIGTAVTMNATGLNQGTSGNVSARVPGGFLITPSGVPYEDLRPHDVVELRMDGEVAGPRRLPASSEWRMHLDIYKARPDAGAIVHTHSMFATTLALLRKEIPAVHYMIAVAGGHTIRCAPYATFGTAELAAFAVTALEDRKACLLANHGMIALGANLRAALRVAREIEALAAQYWRALQVGKPFVLDEEEMERVMEKFKTYGPRAAR